jgi:stage IV sporulation protein FB
MEYFEEPVPGMHSGEHEPAQEEAVVYLPKYERKQETANIWLRSFTSLAAYLIIGYYIFPSYKILLLITAIVMIHELGHFIAMKFFRYNDLGIFFIPLLGAYVSGSKREISQRQSAVILLAGPLPGIIIGSLIFLVNQQSGGHYFFGIAYDRIGMLFIILNLINLFPIYPLDGGQLLNRVFLDEESFLSKAFIILSIAALGYVSWRIYSFSGSGLSFVFLLFPLMMLFRLFGEKSISNIEKKIELEGIHVDLDYDELPDKDYWRIRNILIENHPSFKDVALAPPYEYSAKEEKIMTTIQSLLHRHLIQDVSVVGKLLILLIWIGAIASPWLLKMDLGGYFHRMGF